MLKYKLFVVLMVTVATAVILLFFIKISVADMVTSIYPGWHTTIYPIKWVISFVLVLILFLLILAYLFFLSRKKK